MTSGNVGASCGVRRISATPSADDPQLSQIALEHHTLAEMIEHLERNSRRMPAADRMLAMYRITRSFPDLSNFRLGPNMFEHIPADWLVLARNEAVDASGLIAHGIAARIRWSGAVGDLPRGWQGAVRRCYENTTIGHAPCDTLVGLFIKVEDEARQRGVAAQLVTMMKTLARRVGMSHLIIPLRLPTRYQPENVMVPYEDFAYRTRADGQYADHWLRLHVRLGATVLGHCLTSHQYALHIDDFHQQFEAERVTQSAYIAAKRHAEWHRAYVDVERACAIINDGCVWVRHSIDA